MTWIEVKRWCTAWSLIATALAAATACETQPPYADCELDEEVTAKGICTGDGTAGTGTTSCVVRKHPHCGQSVCLSYKGSQPYCSQTCNTDADCPNSGACWEFSSTQRYCVKSL